MLFIKTSMTSFLARETPKHEFIVPERPQGTPNVHKVWFGTIFRPSKYSELG